MPKGRVPHKVQVRAISNVVRPEAVRGMAREKLPCGVGPHDRVNLPNYGVRPYAHKLNLSYNEPARPPQAKIPPARSPTDKVPAGKAPADEVPAGKIPDGQSSRRQGPHRRSSRRQGPRRTKFPPARSPTTKFPDPGRVPATTDGFKQGQMGATLGAPKCSFAREPRADPGWPGRFVKQF